MKVVCRFRFGRLSPEKSRKLIRIKTNGTAIAPHLQVIKRSSRLDLAQTGNKAVVVCDFLWFSCALLLFVLRALNWLQALSALVLI
jgi:hypothetical protein